MYRINSVALIWRLKFDLKCFYQTNCNLCLVQQISVYNGNYFNYFIKRYIRQFSQLKPLRFKAYHRFLFSFKYLVMNIIYQIYLHCESMEKDICFFSEFKFFLEYFFFQQNRQKVLSHNIFIQFGCNFEHMQYELQSFFFLHQQINFCIK